MSVHLPCSYQELLKRSEEFTDAVLPGEEEMLRRFRLNGEYANMNSSVMYIVDYVSKKYLAISPAYNNILGYSTQYIKDAGPVFFTGLWHKSDFRIMNGQIFPENMKLMEQFGTGEPDLLFTFNYRIRTKKGNYLKFSQSSTYIARAPDGMPLVSLGMVSNITSFKPDNNITLIVEQAHNEDFSAARPVFQKVYFPDEKDSVLTKREIEILKWICDGMSSHQIAGKLHVSIHTVNNHRKNILQKTNAGNLVEVIAFAIRNQIL